MDYGNINGQGTITPLPSDLDISGQAQGDILYFDGSNWVRLAKGTSGEYLKIGASIPSWASVDTSVSNGSITQAKLSTATGSSSGSCAGSSSTIITMTNEYCFFPNIYASVNSGDEQPFLMPQRIDGSSGAFALSKDSNSSSYDVDWRYVNSSDPEHWIFVNVEKSTGEIIGVWEAPDHPKGMKPFGNPSQEYAVYLIDNDKLTDMKQKKKDSSERKSLARIIFENYELSTEPATFKKRTVVEIEDGETMKTFDIETLPKDINGFKKLKSKA